ncbi:ribosomal protein L16p/L10e-domain-containing protein [Blakeslea trispora]|nr:ribosomal protein L16p/L10e-domain-containing protein [Blakeslea trispora]
MFSALRKSALSTIHSTSNVISNVFLQQQTKTAAITQSVRFASNFSPKRTKYRKAHKGKIPIPTGGSTKGTTVEFGDYGLRVKEGVRLTARQLTAVHNALRRKIKPVKGSQMWMRVFPDIPVSSKGNEVRMGKGKGTFEYWACRVPLNRIIFEIAGMRKEIAKEAFRLASHKLPVKVEMVERGAKPIVGAGYVPPIKSTTTTAAAAETTTPSSSA